MKKQFLETGRIVGTHGIKGMVRIDYWADSGVAFSRYKRFFLDSDGQASLTATNVTPHKSICIAKFKGVDSIEDAERLRGKTLYISRDDIELPKDRYLIDDLIGCTVYHQNGSLLGTLRDVSKTGANDVWHIEKELREYLVPAIAEVIVSVDVDEEKIVLNPMKGIFDDED